MGSFVVKRMVREGAYVHVLVANNSSLWRLRDIQDKITVCRGDIASERDVRSYVDAAQPEIIFNIAGTWEFGQNVSMLDPLIQANLQGVLNLFKAIKDLKLTLRCFVQAGSLSEYGMAPVPYREDQREQPASLYSASKLAATQFLQTLHRCYKFPAIVLRLPLMYGPFQSIKMFIPKLITACLKGEDFPMTSGEQTRDFSYVEDVVEAFVSAARYPETVGEVINIGSGRECSIREAAEEIIRLTNSGSRLLFDNLPGRIAEIEHMACDPAKAKNLLQWSATTELNVGLEKTIEWYRSAQTNIFSKNLA